MSVAVDAESMEMVDGAEIDYRDGLQGAGFHINNPNVTRVLRLRFEFQLVPCLMTLVMIRASQGRHPARTQDEGALNRASRTRTQPGASLAASDRGKGCVTGH